MKLFVKNAISKLTIAIFLMIGIAACSTPEEKAEKYYQKGMALLEENPDKAKLEFQNALQIKKNMTKAMYGIALVAERKGDWKATFSLMSKVVQQDPKHIEALIKTGQILLAGGRFDLALDRSNQALAVDKKNVSALNLHAAVQLKLNNPNGAIEYANAALALEPNNQDAYVVLATERLAVKDEIKAIAYLDKALAINEKNLAVQIIRIKALESLSNAAEAEKNYKNIIKLFPETTYARKTYAQFLFKQGRSDEAQQQLQAITIANPKDIQAKLDVVRFIIATRGPAAGRIELENYVKNDPKNYELSFALVNLYQVQKDSTLEDKLLKQIAKNAGDTSDGFKARGLMAYKLILADNKPEAEKLLNAILDIDKRNEQALTLRANLALEAKNYDSAIVDLRTVLRDSPDNVTAALMLANAHEAAGSPELAEEHYIKAFEVSKFLPDYGIPYTQFLIRRKQPERAEKVLEQMMEANPSDAFVMRSLAQSKISRGDYAGAQALADKAKTVGNKNTLSDQILGAISSSKNDTEGTLNAFKRAHQTDPNDVQPIVAIVRTYMQAQRSKDALTFIASVLKSNPKNIEARLIQGQLYVATDDSKNAVLAYSEVIQMQPSNPVAYQQLAALQQKSKQFIEAENTIKKGLVVAPKDFALQLGLASIYESSARYDDAIKVYEVMYKDRPDSEIAANNLASMLSDHRTDKAAIERAYEIAKTLKDSQTPQFLDTFGWASFKVNKLDEAEQALKSAIEKSPDTAIFHFHLAKVYIAKSDKVQAKQALQNAIKLSSNDPFDKKDEANTLLKTL